MFATNLDEVKKVEIAPGVKIGIALHTDNITITVVEIDPGTQLEPHTHVQEQMGIVLQGKVRFFTGEEEKVLQSGDIYYFKSNEPHGLVVESDEKLILMEIFYPKRDDLYQLIKSKLSE